MVTPPTWRVTYWLGLASMAESGVLAVVLGGANCGAGATGSCGRGAEGIGGSGIDGAAGVGRATVGCGRTVSTRGTICGASGATGCTGVILAPGAAIASKAAA